MAVVSACRDPMGCVANKAVSRQILACVANGYLKHTTESQEALGLIIDVHNKKKKKSIIWCMCGLIVIL